MYNVALFFLLCFILTSLQTRAQTACVAQTRFANFWYFGYGGAIDFISGTPVAVPGSAMNTSEGAASISDANGTLLFYTNGVSVYDNTNHRMPNGKNLWGHDNTTQSVLIVPDPGNGNLYYVFTVDQLGGQHIGEAGDLGMGGLSYSVVDITLNGGWVT